MRIATESQRYFQALEPSELTLFPGNTNVEYKNLVKDHKDQTTTTNPITAKVLLEAS